MMSKAWPQRVHISGINLLIKPSLWSLFAHHHIDNRFLRSEIGKGIDVYWHLDYYNFWWSSLLTSRLLQLLFWIISKSIAQEFKLIFPSVCGSEPLVRLTGGLSATRAQTSVLHVAPSIPEAEFYLPPTALRYLLIHSMPAHQDSCYV
jgi:hypothetical protein